MGRTWAAYRAALMVGFSIGLLGCGGQSGELADVVVSDSANVRMVSFADIPSINAPELSARRVFRTNPDETVLVNADAGAFLADGSLLVASLGTSDLVLLDGDGGELRRIGRKGEGPGEYRWPSWVQVVGDTVWVYDKGTRRLTKLGGDSDVLATRTLESDDAVTPLAPLTIFGDIVVAIHGQSGHVRSEGEVRDTTPLLWVGSNGSLDTLSLWPAEERAFAIVPQGRLVVPIVFGRRLVASGGAGAIAVGVTDAVDVHLFDPSGSLAARLVGVAPPVEVSPQEAEEYRRELLSNLPMEGPELAAAWGAGPVRPTVPPLGAVVMDDARRIWIAGTVRPGQKRRWWVAFNASGEPYGRVELPTQFRPWPASTELLAASGNRVALRFRGDYDEEYVEVWEWRCCRR